MADFSTSLAKAFEPWANAYSDYKWLQVAVVFLHLAGTLLAGGTAVVLDRAAFKAAKAGGGEGTRHLANLAASHRVVLTGLTVTVISGLLLFAADVETYWSSAVYWIKMGLFVVLLANGAVMQRTERKLAANGADPGGWRALLRNASISLVLWFAVLFLGVAVVNAS